MKEWLTYLSSDELQGRQMFTEGYGLAAPYIADRLKDWGVKPLGDDGTYFENVKTQGLSRHAQFVGDRRGRRQTKTFKHGDHVTFAANSGGKQTLTFNAVEFVGYGTAADCRRPRRQGQARRVWMPSLAPQAAGAAAAGGGGRGGDAAARRQASAARAARRREGGDRQFAPAPAPPSTAAEAALAQAQDALDKATQAVQQAQQARPRRARRAASARGGRRRSGAAAPPADADLDDRPESRRPRPAAVHRRRDVLRSALRRRPREVRGHQGQGARRARRLPPCRSRRR